MSLSRFALLAGLALGVSVPSLTAAWADGAEPVPQFGAPTAPAAGSFLPARPAVDPASAAPARAAAPAAWVLERPKPPQAAATGGGDAQAPQTGPDTGPLRFYAQQNDLARVAAEIRLLRARFPGWEPPNDLFTETKSTESEQPLWDLFGKHDLDGLKAAMEERRQRTPGWQPSSDLSSKLALAEASDALVRASDAKDYANVVDLASATPGLMTCGNLDAMWRTAEALAATDDEPHAVDAYRYILSSCAKPETRLATIQKASLVVKSPEAMDGLLRLGRRQPNGVNEFGDIRLDATRARIGEAAAGRTDAVPSQADLDQVGARARAPGGAKDAELLGWYALSRKDFAGAETWFRAAMLPSPSPKAAEGLVLALRDGGKMPEALKLAPQFAALGPLNRKLAMEVTVANLAGATAPLPADQAVALGAAIDAEKSADAAQSFGWSLFKTGDIAGAEGWFKKSVAWQPSEPAAVGLMLVAKRLKHPADYAAVVAKYQATYPRVAELDHVMRSADRKPVKVARKVHRGATQVARAGAGGEAGWDQSATDIVHTFESGQTDQALAMMDARRGRHAEPRGLAVVRGWALYKKGDWDQAKAVFDDVGRRGMTDEAQRGLKQIELGYTNPRFR